MKNMVDLTGEESNLLFEVFADWEHQLSQRAYRVWGCTMANLNQEFNKIAAKPEPKHPTPFSLRLSFDERGILEHDAAGKTLGAYIRDRLLGMTPRLSVPFSSG